MDGSRYTPLSSGFMAISIVGFFISIFLVIDLSLSWGVTFSFFFILMLFASIISMTKAEPIPEHMHELAIHEPHRKYGNKIPRPIKKFVWSSVKWYDGVFFLFMLLIVYYIYNSVALTTAPVTPFMFISVLATAIITLVIMIVDVLSREDLNWAHQLIYTILLLLTGPIGMIIYYVYKRYYS